MSNFSFSHSVFKRLVLQIQKKQGLFGTGLKVSLSFDMQKIDRRYITQFQLVIKALKMLLWHLSMEPMKEMSSLKKSKR